MSDLIERSEAVEAVNKALDKETILQRFVRKIAVDAIIKMPSAQTEQTKMIKEIREWINYGNRGNADYFIVDKIEEIINKYE